MNLVKILKQAYFTDDEIKLAESIDRIIFSINITVPSGNRHKGATFEEIKQRLKDRRIFYDDSFVLSVLQHMENQPPQFKVLSEIDGKWFSIRTS